MIRFLVLLRLWPILLLLASPVFVLAQTTAEEFYQLGVAAYWSTHFDAEETRAYLDRAIELDPGFVDAYAYRAEVGRLTGDFEAAKADFKQALALDPGSAMASSWLARLLISQENVGAALLMAREAVRLAPDLLEAHYNLARVLQSQGDYEKAIAQFGQVAEIDPAFAAAYYWRGDSYVNLKQYDQAIADYTQAINLKPDNPFYYDGRGNLYLDIESYDQAIADFEKAVELDPENDHALGNIGYALSLQGDYLNALRYHVRAYDLAPDVKWHGGSIDRILTENLLLTLSDLPNEVQQYWYNSSVNLDRMAPVEGRRDHPFPLYVCASPSIDAVWVASNHFQAEAAASHRLDVFNNLSLHRTPEEARAMFDLITARLDDCGDTATRAENQTEVASNTATFALKTKVNGPASLIVSTNGGVLILWQEAIFLSSTTFVVSYGGGSSPLALPPLQIAQANYAKMIKTLQAGQ